MRRSLFVALAALTAVGVATLASAAATAAPPTITFVSPSPAEGATLTSNAVSFTFTYPRKPNQAKTFDCELTGPTASSGPCDPTVAFGTNGSQSGISYSGLANGSYALTASLISNGGAVQATATRHFTVDVPANEIQRVRVDNATGGTFTLTFSGQTTAPIAYNATAAQVQAELEALSNIGHGNVSVTGGDLSTSPVDITFMGIYAGVDVPQLTADATALTGTTPTVSVSTIQQGGS
jgi:hypothetical protein